MQVKILLLNEKGKVVKMEDSNPREEFEAIMLFGDLQHKMFASEAGIDKNAMCDPNN